MVYVDGKKNKTIKIHTNIIHKIIHIYMRQTGLEPATLAL